SMPTALKTMIVMASHLTRGTKPPLVEPRPERPEQGHVGLLDLVNACPDRLRRARMAPQLAHMRGRPYEMLLAHDPLTSPFFTGNCPAIKSIFRPSPPCSLATELPPQPPQRNGNQMPPPLPVAAVTAKRHEVIHRGMIATRIDLRVRHDSVS